MQGLNAGTIIVADDHPLFRDALRQAIQVLRPFHRVEMAGDFESVIAHISAARDVDLVLLDLNMPGNIGFTGLLRLRSEYPEVPILVVSATEDASTISRSLEIGASGFIPKSTDAEGIREAIAAVLQGDMWLPPDFELDAEGDNEFSRTMERLQSLTPQQNRVLAMLSEGLLNKQIAYELGVSEATVKAHVSAVLTKLDVDSRTQAVILLGRLGLNGSAESTSATI
jgi:DNA-binding NarL/FixJ family response regulator